MTKHFSFLGPAYEIDEKIASAQLTKMFIQSILHNSKDQAEIEEFTAKLAETEKEISKLIEEA